MCVLDCGTITFMSEKKPNNLSMSYWIRARPLHSKDVGSSPVAFPFLLHSFNLLFLICVHMDIFI